MRFIPEHARPSFAAVSNTLFMAFLVSSAFLALILYKLDRFQYVVFQLAVTAPAIAAVVTAAVLLPWLRGAPRFGIGVGILIALMHTAATVTIAALAGSAQPHLTLHPDLRFAVSWLQPNVIVGLLAAQAVAVPLALRRFSQ